MQANYGNPHRPLRLPISQTSTDVQIQDGIAATTNNLDVFDRFLDRLTHELLVGLPQAQGQAN